MSKEMRVQPPKDGEEGQTKLVIGRGGARKGAGRKPTGLENRKVSISMPAECWKLVDQLQEHEIKTRSDLLAELIEIALEMKLIEHMNRDGEFPWDEKKR